VDDPAHNGLFKYGTREDECAANQVGAADDKAVPEKFPIVSLVNGLGLVRYVSLAICNPETPSGPNHHGKAAQDAEQIFGYPHCAILEGS
jgi:hypothetical protein